MFNFLCKSKSVPKEIITNKDEFACEPNLQEYLKNSLDKSYNLGGFTNPYIRKENRVYISLFKNDEINLLIELQDYIDVLTDYSKYQFTVDFRYHHFIVNFVYGKNKLDKN